MMRLLILGTAGVVLCVPSLNGQTAGPAAEAYVNENATDQSPLKLHELTGVVRGLGGDAIPRATVLIFSEAGHTLLASGMSDRDGKFKFEKIDRGLYRVVAKVAGLCAANIPVKLESSLLAHRKLVITMRPKDIDTCSYGMTK